MLHPKSLKINTALHLHLGISNAISCRSFVFVRQGMEGGGVLTFYACVRNVHCEKWLSFYADSFRFFFCYVLEFALNSVRRIDFLGTRI